MSLAIAYNMKRRNKARGGEVCNEECGSPCDIHEGKRMEEMTSDFADGGEAEDQDMVSRIMAKRQKMYSKGGRVANQDEAEADFMPNEFDDLHLRDDLESSYTGENSGDYLSSPGEEERRRDMVSRIMASRRKRDRNPSPA